MIKCVSKNEFNMIDAVTLSMAHHRLMIGEFWTAGAVVLIGITLSVIAVRMARAA